MEVLTLTEKPGKDFHCALRRGRLLLLGVFLDIKTLIYCGISRKDA